MTKKIVLVGLMAAALEATVWAQQTAPPAAPVEAPAAITTPEGRQEIKGEVQMRAALLRSNDDLLAKDEEIAQLKYFLAKLQRAINDRDKARMEPDLLKSFGAPAGSRFDWQTFKPIPPPVAQAPQPAAGAKTETPKGGTTP